MASSLYEADLYSAIRIAVDPDATQSMDSAFFQDIYCPALHTLERAAHTIAENVWQVSMDDAFAYSPPAQTERLKRAIRGGYLWAKREIENG